MKVCLTFTIFALAGVIRVQAEGNLQTCIDPNTFDPNKDYFPDKVEPLDSEHWEIEYFNSYKILRNTVDDESFVLYQCGTPVPTTTINNGDEKFLHVIPVPLQDGAALTSTTHIPHFEQLGILDQVKGWIGDTNFISSPCLNGRMETGDVEIVLRNDRGNQTLVDGLKSSVGEGMVYFHSSGDDFSSTLLNVSVSAYKEKKNEAIYEWNKFFAVFFNLEAKSNELVSAASARYQCYTEEAREVLTAVTDGVKPNVIWASWNNWTGVPGWDIARCPNYYCEYAELCSAEILSRDENDGTVEYYGRKIHSPEAFFEIAKDYDAFIYAAFDWDDVYELYRDELDQFKSVQDKRVFDVLGSGENTWFEQRLAEYGTYIYPGGISLWDVDCRPFAQCFPYVSSSHTIIMHYLYMMIITTHTMAQYRNCYAGLLFRCWYSQYHSCTQVAS